MASMSKKIQISNGSYVTVDDGDYDRLMQWSWSAHKDGYACRAQKIEGKRVAILMHRFIMGAELGDLDLDHINGDRSDNRQSNLRFVTRQQNSLNRKIRSDNKSGYKGVYFRKDNDIWRVAIMNNGIRVNLGHFKCKHEAAKIYNEAAIKYHGEYARLNVIKGDE